jgi:hypothetical protein
VSRRPWDDVARETVKDNAHDWYSWAHRNFPEDEGRSLMNSKAYWSREHFKVALANMPAGHPDRWKYEAGARYAVWQRPNVIAPTGWAAVRAIGSGLLAGFTFVYGAGTGIFALWLIPLIIIIGWVAVAIRRHRVLGR